jgi:hypothetical protein
MALTCSLTQIFTFEKRTKDFEQETCFCMKSMVFCNLYELFWEPHLLFCKFQSWSEKCTTATEKNGNYDNFVDHWRELFHGHNSSHQNSFYTRHWYQTFEHQGALIEALWYLFKCILPSLDPRHSTILLDQALRVSQRHRLHRTERCGPRGTVGFYILLAICSPSSDNNRPFSESQ